MNEELLQLNAALRHEADEILYGKGLFVLLNQFGTPHITGSYALNLMTWRDLDIYVEANDLPEEDFFLMGGKICTALAPVKMSFRNERITRTPHLPAGLYWGTYLGNERTGAWKIDMWVVNGSEYNRLNDYTMTIKEKLTPTAISHILDIKSQCWKDPEYRRMYYSTDIYNAVLDNKITGMSQFQEYLKALPLMRSLL
jgi:hypothetical protein